MGEKRITYSHSLQSYFIEIWTKLLWNSPKIQQWGVSRGEAEFPNCGLLRPMQAWKAAFRGGPGWTLAGSLRSPESGYQRLRIHAGSSSIMPTHALMATGKQKEALLPVASPPSPLLSSCSSISRLVFWFLCHKASSSTLPQKCWEAFQCSLCALHSMPSANGPHLPLPPDRPCFSIHTLKSCSRHARSDCSPIKINNNLKNTRSIFSKSSLSLPAQGKSPPSLGMCELSTPRASTLLSFQHTTASPVPKTPHHYRRRV